MQLTNRIRSSGLQGDLFEGLIIAIVSLPLVLFFLAAIFGGNPVNFVHLTNTQ